MKVNEKKIKVLTERFVQKLLIRFFSSRFSIVRFDKSFEIIVDCRCFFLFFLQCFRQQKYICVSFLLLVIGNNRGTKWWRAGKKLRCFTNLIKFQRSKMFFISILFVNGFKKRQYSVLPSPHQPAFWVWSSDNDAGWNCNFSLYTKKFSYRNA